MNTTKIISMAVVQCALVFGAFAGSIDKIDSLAVRSILNDIGWKNVPVDSVIITENRGLFGNASRVTALNLTYRPGLPKINLLPTTIGKLPELLSLSLAGNALSALPPEVTSLLKLTQLNLSSNLFTAFPDQLNRMSALQILDVGHNKIDSLPSSIVTQLDLVILTCDYNRIAKLPAQLKSLSGLKNLSLIANQLDSIPATISFLTNLELLRLDSNQLSTLPLQITNLQRVKIDIAGNHLCALTNQTLIAWLVSHHLTPEWRASQQCNDTGYSATATDSKTGTVVLFTTPFIPSSAIAHGVTVDQYSSGAVSALLPGKTVLKMVKIGVDNAFTGRVTTFLITFSYGDITLPSADPSLLSIYYYDAANRQATYIGGSVDLKKKTVAVQTGTQGVYSLVYKGVISAARYAVPLQGTGHAKMSLAGRELRISLATGDAPLLTVSFMSLNGQTLLRATVTASAGQKSVSLTLPRALIGKTCAVSVTIGSETMTRIITPLE